MAGVRNDLDSIPPGSVRRLSIQVPRDGACSKRQNPRESLCCGLSRAHLAWGKNGLCGLEQNARTRGCVRNLNGTVRLRTKITSWAKLQLEFPLRYELSSRKLKRKSARALPLGGVGEGRSYRNRQNRKSSRGLKPARLVLFLFAAVAAPLPSPSQRGDPWICPHEAQSLCACSTSLAAGSSFVGTSPSTTRT